MRFFASARCNALWAGVLFFAVLGEVIAAPKVERWSAASGAQVYFIEARGLPILDVSVEFAAGSSFDLRERAGLARLTLTLLKSGTDEASEAELSARLADVGAQTGESFDRDRAGITLRTLSSAAEREKALGLIAAMLQRPGFPADALEREKIRLAASVRDQETRPAGIAERRFYAALYSGHPYGILPTEESIRAIARADVDRFYREHYAAARAVIAIVGDASKTEAAAIADRLSASLPPAQASAPVPDKAAPSVAGESLSIPHPATQSHVMLGMPAIARSDPDYFPLFVGNYVLGGGGFVSRLYREVREKRGYAYSVYSYFLPLAGPGPFLLGLQTRKEQSKEAIARARSVLEEFIEKGPTEAELKAARSGMIGGFALRIDSNRKLLDQLAVIGFYRLPLTWLDEYSAHVARVSVADVRRAFRRIDPSKLVMVVVGAPD